MLWQMPYANMTGKEIKSLKDLKEYGNILKQEKQIYNAAVKECQRQEMLKKPIIAR